MPEATSPPRPVPHGRLQRLRVPLGFAFGLLFFLLARPQLELLAVGLVLAGCGLAVRVWATGYLRKHDRLCSSGPYRWTRNPLYLGSFLLGLGFCIAAGNPWLALTFGILFPLVYLPVMKREELELAHAYGPSYLAYRERVPRFLPRVPAAECGTDRFEWSQVWHNREYNAFLGYALVASFLVWRAIQ